MMNMRLPFRLSAHVLLGLVLGHYGYANVAYAQTEHQHEIIADTQVLRTVLPTDAVVTEVLSQHPQVRQARLMQQTAQITADKYALGNVGWALQSGVVQRVDHTTHTRSVDPTLSLERTMRLPAKYKADLALADVERAHGEAQLADAWHEAAKSLLVDWFSLKQAYLEDAQLQQHQAVLERQLTIVEQRMRAGDAARLDQVVLTQELFNLKAQRMQVQGTIQQQKASLEQYMPMLNSAWVQQDVPLVPSSSLLHNVNALLTPASLQAVLQHHHELGLAILEHQRYLQLVERAKAERIADPKVNIGVGTELQGDQRLIGVGVTIPFNQKRANLETALMEREADRALQRVQVLRKRLLSEVTTRGGIIKTGVQQLNILQQGQKNMQAQTDMMAKAYRLGEVSLQDWLLAERQRIAFVAQYNKTILTVLEQYARLLLDTHQLWVYPDHDEPVP